MAMVWYAAIIEKAKDGFGVWFPDIDGCVTAGDTIEDATAKAGEVLAFWFEDAKDVPLPSGYAAAKKRAVAGNIVMLVPARIPDRLERVNVSLTDATVAMGDELAADEGTTRSGLITQLIHERWRVRHATSIRAGAPIGGARPSAKRGTRLKIGE
ncbi:MAG: type II toxin-antitoxin system HicB family antitoxin [Alphaproteobacteria bacterium]